jgi:alkanesulfonate monooxygenase SsuD/methylene tetrahydromethanopterin reductase-like flavin-dependent oxidoreductase (luciferase family)
MTSLVFGRSEEDFSARLRGKQAGEVRDRGVIAGTGEQVREQLQQLEAAGVQRVMLRWLDLDDLAGLEALAKAVLA